MIYKTEINTSFNSEKVVEFYITSDGVYFTDEELLQIDNNTFKQSKNHPVRGFYCIACTNLFDGKNFKDLRISKVYKTENEAIDKLDEITNKINDWYKNK